MENRCHHLIWGVCVRTTIGTHIKRYDTTIRDRKVRETIPIKDSRIRLYMMVHGDQNQFVPTHRAGRELASQIEKFLTRT